METALVVVVGVVVLFLAALAGTAAADSARAKKQSVVPMPPMPNPDPAAVSTGDTLRGLVLREALAHGVGPALAAAIVYVESGWDPTAVSPEDSYGLMQVLCRPDGSGGCKNHFDIVGWPPASADALLDPTVNVPLGMQILAWNVQRYGMWQGVAVYNDWAARDDPSIGPFRNQGYVDRVQERYYQLRAAGTPLAA